MNIISKFSQSNSINNRIKNGIKSVKLMGSVNKIVDTKLHPILNFQENVQATVYSFFVTYEDNTTETIETYDDEIISTLMNYVNEKKQQTDTIQNNFSVLDELSSLQALYEKKIIPEDLYNKKREELLGILENATNQSQVDGKLILERKNPFLDMPRGLKIEIDSNFVGKIYAGDKFAFNVDAGTHTLSLTCSLFEPLHTTFTINYENPHIYILCDIKNQLTKSKIVQISTRIGHFEEEISTITEIPLMK